MSLMQLELFAAIGLLGTTGPAGYNELQLVGVLVGIFFVVFGIALAIGRPTRRFFPVLRNPLMCSVARDSHPMPRFRPRLRFSLRTLFVLVTIGGAGLGWGVREWRIFNHREAVRDWMATRPRSAIRGGPTDRAAVDRIINETVEEWRANHGVSRCRLLLGDYPMPLLIFGPELSPNDRQQIEEAFPEAPIYVLTGK